MRRWTHNLIDLLVFNILSMFIIIIIIKGNVPNVMPIFVTEVLSRTGKQ